MYTDSRADEMLDRAKMRVHVHPHYGYPHYGIYEGTYVYLHYW